MKRKDKRQTGKLSLLKKGQEYTVKEIVELTGIARSTIEAMIRSRRLKVRLENGKPKKMSLPVKRTIYGRA